MDLIGDDPILSMSGDSFRIFSRNMARAPQYVGSDAVITDSLVSEGCKIYGTVTGSVLSGGVVIEEGAVVKDSVIMEDVTIGRGARVFSSIVDSDSVIEAGVTVGKENADKNNITVIAKGSLVNKSTEQE